MSLKKVLIVDDERLARENIKTALNAFSQLKVIGEADNCNLAKDLITQYNPDIIFLDIQLMGETGFEIISDIPPTCKTIFVTAYNKYRVRAFELNALAYLLKPINTEELKIAFKKISVKKDERIELTKKLHKQDELYVSTNNYHRFITVEKIKYIKAEGNYSLIVYEDNSRFIKYQSMQKWIEILPDDIFKSIHRSFICNTLFISRFFIEQNNTFIQLKFCETKLPVSRRKLKELKGTNQ